MIRLLLPFLALVPGLLVPPQESRQAAPAAAAPLHSALAPADRLGEDWWKERYDAANKRIAQGDVELIFLGDSITQGWEEEGQDVWTEFYGKRRAPDPAIIRRILLHVKRPPDPLLIAPAWEPALFW